ncbi:MAG TPA: hypothetical protein PKK33_09085, partial [Candidatus Cloacimonadota bacterium]|nr:hypothetical protein [Candidatus Cloacimonadota bacterium]
SEADRTQFFKDLPELFKRDPKTRMSKMDTLMQSEETVLKLAALLWKGEGGLKTMLSNSKEALKKEIEDKLGAGDKPGSGTVVVPREFNPDNLV